MTAAEQNLDELREAEAQFFDEKADIRTLDGNIPEEADMRRATRRRPRHRSDYAADPEMSRILDRGAKPLFIKHVAHRPGGRVLDICCGPGWLALELARNGQHVDAYDLSPRALALARRMLEENPYTEGFGSVHYHLQDVSEVDLGENTYDAVSGWSAFHHVPELPGFMDRVWRALRPGGIVATMDDMPTGFIEAALRHSANFFLPIYTLGYRRKIGIAFERLTGRSRFPDEVFSPMEQAKHSTVFDIERIWREQYEVLVEYRQNAFAGTPVMQLSGPDWFRYPAGRALVAIDAALCGVGVVHGFERILIARKPHG